MDFFIVRGNAIHSAERPPERCFAQGKSEFVPRLDFAALTTHLSADLDARPNVVMRKEVSKVAASWPMSRVVRPGDSMDVGGYDSTHGRPSSSSEAASALS